MLSQNFAAKLLTPFGLVTVLVIFFVLPIAGSVGLIEHFYFENDQEIMGDILLGLATFTIGTVLSILMARWIVAERKRAEDGRQEGDRLVRQIIDLVPYPIFVKNSEGRFLLVNEAGVDFAGRAVKDMVGYLESDWVEDQEMLQQIRAEDQEVIAGGQSKFVPEIRYVDANGQLHIMQTIKTPARTFGSDTSIIVGIAIDITARVQAEEALRESEARFRAVWEIAADAMVLSDAEGTVFMANPAYYRLYQLTPAQVIGQNFAVIYPAGERRQKANELYRAIFSGEMIHPAYEALIQLPNGSTRFVESKATFLVENDQRRAMLSVIRDITEHKQAEESLRQVFEQERHQRQVADSLREVATLLNSSLDPKIVLDKILEQLAQVIPNDGMGIFLQENNELFLAGGRGPAAQINLKARLPLTSQNPTARVFQTQRLHIITDVNSDPHWLIWPEGHRVQSWLGAPLRVSQQAIGVLTVDSFSLDSYAEADGQILQTFANQAALAIHNARLFEAVRQYERIVSATSDGIALLDQNYVYQIVNQTYLNMNKKSLDQIIGHSVSDLLGTEVFEQTIKKELDKALAGEIVHYQAWFEYPVIGRRFISVTYSPYRELDNTIFGIIASSRDLTELELLREQLSQAQKLEAVGQLAAGVAHHFNNMLTVIMGHVDLSLYKLPPYHPVASNLEQVQTITQRAADMVWQILSFARKQFIRPQVVNLNDLMLNAETHLTQRIPASVELETHLAPDLASVKVDAKLFEPLLMHLVDNACDAMPQGGRLTLATANISLPTAEVSPATEIPAGNYVLLTVSDTGIGITEAVKAHLFEPFFTTKEVGQGTGLGLATCFGIVKQHGGYITVVSQPGRGTTFKIYLSHAT